MVLGSKELVLHWEFAYIKWFYIRMTAIIGNLSIGPSVWWRDSSFYLELNYFSFLLIMKAAAFRIEGGVLKKESFTCTNALCDVIYRQTTQTHTIKNTFPGGKFAYFQESITDTIKVFCLVWNIADGGSFSPVSWSSVVLTNDLLSYEGFVCEVEEPEGCLKFTWKAPGKTLLNTCLNKPNHLASDKARVHTPGITQIVHSKIYFNYIE